MTQHPKFDCYRDRAMYWRANLISPAGTAILSTSSFDTEPELEAVLESIALNAKKKSAWQRKKAKNGSYYGVLIALSTSERLGMTEMYRNAAALDNCIELVTDCAAKAAITYRDF